MNGQLSTYDSTAGNGISTGVLVLVRKGIFEAGAQGQRGVGFFTYSYTSVGGVAGLGLTPADQWRLELLGEAGLDSYTRFGADKGFFSDDPGASAQLPYAGARVGMSRRVRAFEIGVSGGYATDFDRKDVMYTYSQSNWFTAPSTDLRTVRVGTERLTASLSLGGVIDL